VSYTVLRVVDEGIPFFDQHLARFAAAGDDAAAAFCLFASTAIEGIYAVKWNGSLAVETRAASRLFDGIPVRYLPSPYSDLTSPFSKPASPNRYDGVRLTGFATLLTSPDERELWESCSASLVSWSGSTLLFPPDDRPRVASVAEKTLRNALATTQSPILRDSREPLGLLNAVKGFCTIATDRDPFPAAAKAAIEEAIRQSTRRS